MTCHMHSFADAWVVLVQAHKAELQRATTQLAEKQSMVEVKQAEISKLGDCLTASQQEVAAVHQELASAAQAYSAVAQVCNVLACCLAGVLRLQKSIQQLFSWHICSTLPCNDAITVLDMQHWAGL